MNMRARIRVAILLCAVLLTMVGGMVIKADTTPAEAARCCWVMVCGPQGCWEECRTCPKFP